MFFSFLYTSLAHTLWNLPLRISWFLFCCKFKILFSIFILIYRNEVDFYILTWFVSCNFEKFTYSTSVFGRCLLFISFPCFITLTTTYMIVKTSYKNRHSCMEHILWGNIQYFQLCCCRFFYRYTLSDERSSFNSSFEGYSWILSNIFPLFT